MGNGVTGSPPAFGAVQCASESRFPSQHFSRPCSSVAEHTPGTGEVTRSDSGRGLHVDVAQQVERLLAKQEVTGS